MGGAGAAGSGATTRLRVVAANLSSGNDQSYTSGEGLRILEGLTPDVVLIQEFNYGGNTDAEIQSFVAAAIGTGASYVRDVGAQIPNGVLSRYPIEQSGEWVDPAVSNRGFAWAEIDLPGGQRVWAVSVHLLTTSATNRDTEAQALDALVAANVPAGAFVVIGGDFNTDVRTEPCIATLSSIVDTAAPYPADGAGNDNTSGPRTKPHDWVLTDPALRGLEVPVSIGANLFPHGLVFDSRVYTPLTDVPPVQQGDSGAVNMQHMAVVRDFALPGGAGGASGGAGAGAEG